MATTNDLKALERAVKQNPADAALRLVYADALEEAGQAGGFRKPGAYEQRQMAGYLQKGEVRGNVVAVREDTPGGSLLARLVRLSTGKQLHYYRFATAERREQWVAEVLAQEERSVQAKADREAAKKAARENFVNPYKVGDLFYTSWGYDQTNIDFYECVKVGPKSVELRKVACNAEYTHWAAGRAAPRKGSYVGEPFRVCVQVSVHEGKPHYYLPFEFGSYYPWDGVAKSFSEYA